MTNQYIFLFFSLLTVTAELAFSSTITTEDIVGDFHGGQLFTLNAGENIFNGSQLWGADPVDGFRFVVEEGYTASINIDYTISGLSDSGALSWVWELQRLPEEAICAPVRTPHDCVLSAQNSLLASEIFADPKGFPYPDKWDYTPIQGYRVDDGVYAIFDNYGFSQDGGGLFTYSINVNVSEVPLPGAGFLYGFALIMLSLKKRILSRHSEY